MDTQEQMRYCESQYWATVAANKDYDKTLLEYFLYLDFSKEDCWEYSPSECMEAGWDEPDWL